MSDCHLCGLQEEEVAHYRMPCCGRVLCWERCLTDSLPVCPACGVQVSVVAFDQEVGGPKISMPESEVVDMVDAQLLHTIALMPERANLAKAFGLFVGEIEKKSGSLDLALTIGMMMVNQSALALAKKYGAKPLRLE